jgi:hypothetical protein
MEFIVCPECAEIAEVEWRRGGMTKLRCVQRHWFLMPFGDHSQPDRLKNRYNAVQATTKTPMTNG